MQIMAQLQGVPYFSPHQRDDISTYELDTDLTKEIWDTMKIANVAYIQVYVRFQYT